MAKIQFQHDLSDIRERIDALPEDIDRYIKAVMARQGPIATGDMKERAPWTDRTGNARAGLHTTPPVATELGSKTLYEMIFAHVVYYGIWLEIANSGRYQILMPSIIKHGNIIMDNLSDLFGELERMKR